jgi:hypothetical protein
MNWPIPILVSMIWLGASITAHASRDSAIPPGLEPVRLEQPTIGCSTRPALDRIAVSLHEDGQAALKQRDCQRFEDFRGDVVRENNDDICVLGEGNARCLWFQRSAFAPAP